MQMKMILEGLIPGVEHGDDAKGCLKTGLAKLKECLTNCFKKKGLRVIEWVKFGVESV